MFVVQFFIVDEKPFCALTNPEIKQRQTQVMQKRSVFPKQEINFSSDEYLDVVNFRATRCYLQHWKKTYLTRVS